MKQFAKVLPLLAAVAIALPSVGFNAQPAVAYYRGNDGVRTVVTAGAIGAGAGAVAGVLNGGDVLRNAAVGAVIGAGTGAVYQTVRYGWGGNNGWHNGGGYYGNYGGGRSYPYYQNRYMGGPRHHCPTSYGGGGYYGNGGGYGYGGRDMAGPRDHDRWGYERY